jgi:hypothetical protein
MEAARFSVAARQTRGFILAILFHALFIITATATIRSARIDC